MLGLQRKSVRLPFAAGLGAAVVLAALAVPHQARAALPASCTALLTNDCLLTLLTDMGFEPKPLTKGYLVVVKQDTWTINIQVVISENTSKLGLNANLGDVTEASVTAPQWLAVMAANADVDPSSFYYDAKLKRLMLHRTMDNRYMTSAILRGQIDRFAS